MKNTQNVTLTDKCVSVIMAGASVLAPRRLAMPIKLLSYL